MVKFFSSKSSWKPKTQPNGTVHGFSHYMQGTVFFFSQEKFNATHSLVLGKLCIFFFRISGKKKYRCIYFFPRNSLKATHSAERQLPFVKRYFCTFAVYFFFPTKMCIFFPRNSLLPTHSLVFKGRKKKIQPRKKKYSFLLTHSIFPQKCQKINFSRKKKRYLCPHWRFSFCKKGTFHSH